MKIMATALNLLIDTGATCSITNCDTFTEIENFPALFVIPLENSHLALNGHTMPMKGEVVIHSAFVVEYTCAFEHMVLVSNSSEARLSILGLHF